jgi:hypothetical protein
MGWLKCSKVINNIKFTNLQSKADFPKEKESNQKSGRIILLRHYESHVRMQRKLLVRKLFEQGDPAEHATHSHWKDKDYDK